MTTATATAGAWRVRHEGSPKSIEGLTLLEVAEGLQEARWEPTDEVRGPDDAEWVAIENHPLLEEIAAEIDPPPPRVYDDESRVDMNALIDVCLVLLVFFILTTSYAVLTKRLDAPDATPADTKPITVTPKQVEQQMILVAVKLESGKPVYLVEGKQVAAEALAAELKRFVGSSGKTILLLEHDGEVPHGAVVKVQDAAKGAGMSKVLVAIPKTK